MRGQDRVLLVALTGALGVGFAPGSGAGDTAPPLLKRYEPVYPELARQMHVGGMVVLKVQIAGDGRVSDVLVKSGHPLLADSARSAVLQWRYAATGQPSETVVTVMFNPPPRD